MSYFDDKMGDWAKILSPILNSAGFNSLGITVQAEGKKYGLSPQFDDVFNAFKATQYKDLRVIILGQDPYPDPKAATGIAFANPDDNMLYKPSLEAIIKELQDDLDDLYIDIDPTLKGWTDQGVLLLNTSLTCRPGRPGSHSELWKPFIEAVIDTIVVQQGRTEIPILAMGKQAQKFVAKYDGLFGQNPMKFIAHPAVASYGGKGFFGTKPFSWINAVLHMTETPEIDWTAIKNG